MMPRDLLLVRHGQSEGNVAVHLLKQGDDSAFTQEFLARHSSEWRLSPVGERQADIAGSWIRDNIDLRFDRHYTSDYVRALETSAHLDLPDAKWYCEFLLRERDRDETNVILGADRKIRFAEYNARTKRQSFYTRDLGGESMADVCIRIDRFIQTLHRECADKRVIVVCHGEVMLAFRVRLERMTQEQWRELNRSVDPRNRINNCQILHYTRRNPENGEIAPYLNWVHSICPTKPEWSWKEWLTIVRPTFTTEELRDRVSRYPRIHKGSYE